MKNLTIRGVDEKLEGVLKEKAEREHTSMNKLILRILHETLLGDTESIEFKTYDDLDHLAGTWTAEEAREFDEAVSSFDTIDEDLWK